MKLDECFSCGGMSIQFNSFKGTAMLEIHGLRGTFKELSLDEVKFWAEKFNQALETFEKAPKVGSKVRIIEGKFSGFEGEVVDIDGCDKIRPLAIAIDNVEFEGMCFLDYGSAEAIKKGKDCKYAISTDGGNTLQCPECFADVSGYDSFCRHCGVKLRFGQ